MVIHLVLLFVFAVLYFSYYFLMKNQNYWKIRNVPYAKPLPLLGNYKDYILLRKSLFQAMNEICQQFPNEPYIGSFYGTNPALIIQDPNLLKLILSKEFFFFNGRETSDHNHKEPTSKNMFFAHGDNWKVLRTNLTPLFSSMKLKNMFYLIKNSSDTFESLLVDEVTNKDIDIRKLLTRYTIECITGCAFGLCADSMKKDKQKNPFISVGEQIFDTSDYKGLKAICRSMWPGLFYLLRLKVVDDDVDTFFSNLISQAFKTREETKITKKDFVDLILTWKKHNCITGDSMSNSVTGDRETVSIEVTEELLIAQCFLFFAAGFETTSTSMSFLLFELAKNQNAQNKMIEEVDNYFAKHKTIEYECINEMPYTEACIEESLRLYPVLGHLTREVMHEFSLPTGLRLNKGDRIHIPVHHIQHNPEHFPEPELFRPERFFGEERKNIKPYTYMPFGEGPRTCIGMRFAKMPMYAAYLTIFKNYRVELAENMPHTIAYNPKSVVTQSIDGIHLKLISRKA